MVQAIERKPRKVSSNPLQPKSPPKETVQPLTALESPSHPSRDAKPQTAPADGPPPRRNFPQQQIPSAGPPPMRRGTKEEFERHEEYGSGSSPMPEEPPAPDTPPEIAPGSAEQCQIYDRDQQATIIRSTFFASSMAAAIGTFNLVTPTGYRAFLDQLTHDAGDPTDPLEIMQLEQLAMAHFRIGELHSRAADAKDAKVVEVFSSAATQLTAEFRRGMLARVKYRQMSGRQPGKNHPDGEAPKEATKKEASGKKASSQRTGK